MTVTPVILWSLHKSRSVTVIPILQIWKSEQEIAMTLQRENLTLQRKTLSQENKKANSKSHFLIISAFTELVTPPNTLLLRSR